MKIQTFSVIAGSRACDGKCPFCSTKMTGYRTLPKPESINERNLHKALLLAKRHEAESLLILVKANHFYILNKLLNI